MSIQVLIVEDDKDLCQLLSQYFGISGFDSLQVYNGLTFRQKLDKQAYNVAVIDMRMPEEVGFAPEEKLVHTHPNFPLLFVTTHSQRQDVKKGLRLGSDDYLIKPFDADELIQRIHNILKRTGFSQETITPRESIAIGIYTLDPQNLELSTKNEKHMLTEKEAALLYYLYLNRNKVIRRKNILNHLWKQDDFFSGRSMDVFITRLRKHLAEDETISIESIRGIGFRFCCT